MRFSSQIITTGNAFAPSQALTFRSMDYIADHSYELHLFVEASAEDN
jgi:hypothetical protein